MEQAAPPNLPPAKMPSLNLFIVKHVVLSFTSMPHAAELSIAITVMVRLLIADVIFVTKIGLLLSSPMLLSLQLDKECH